MRLLRGYRNVPPADRQALELMFVKVAQLAADLPEVRNPTQGGHGFRRKADSNPMIADSR